MCMFIGNLFDFDFKKYLSICTTNSKQANASISEKESNNKQQIKQTIHQNPINIEIEEEKQDDSSDIQILNSNKKVIIEIEEDNEDDPKDIQNETSNNNSKDIEIEAADNNHAKSRKIVPPSENDESNNQCNNDDISEEF